MNNKHLLKLLDLSREEIHEILDTADQRKDESNHGLPHEPRKGKTLAMIFSKNSTRTRVSFEVGMCQLGATPCSTAMPPARSAGASRSRTPPGS